MLVGLQRRLFGVNNATALSKAMFNSKLCRNKGKMGHKDTFLRMCVCSIVIFVRLLLNVAFTSDLLDAD